MTIPSFPAYAKILLSGYQQQRESALLRSDMESGPPRQAKVRSRVMVTRSCTVYLSSLADFQSFETWYSVELSEGSSWFTYVDPVDGVSKNARFADGGYTATPNSVTSESWNIALKIETWGA